MERGPHFDKTFATGLEMHTELASCSPVARSKWILWLLKISSSVYFVIGAQAEFNKKMQFFH